MDGSKEVQECWIGQRDSVIFVYCSNCLMLHIWGFFNLALFWCIEHTGSTSLFQLRHSPPIVNCRLISNYFTVARKLFKWISPLNVVYFSASDHHCREGKPQLISKTQIKVWPEQRTKQKKWQKYEDQSELFHKKRCRSEATKHSYPKPQNFSVYYHKWKLLWLV